MATPIPTVACILPVYNYAHYLDEALQSVFSQTRVPDEVIVVDDCSTDNPKAICDKYPVKYIRHDVNKGLSGARNTGIQACTSKYVFSFDADDILRPEAVEKHLELAEENTIVTCGLMAFGAENYTAYPKVATLETLFKGNCIYSNSLFPKKLWDKVGGFDESMRKGLEDWEMWIRMAGAGAKFVTSNYVALLWRRHGSTMSSTLANPNWNEVTTYIKEKNKYLLDLHRLE
jgi:glycosyltransferase involved in cell wall biosynthesis